jgi:hypothetical protein
MTTGIKWDFNEEHILAGQVVCFWLYCGCMDATVRRICEYILLLLSACVVFTFGRRPNQKEAFVVSVSIPMNIPTLRLPSTYCGL